MYLGKIVESADSDSLCARPMHPYTQHCSRRCRPTPTTRRGTSIAGEVRALSAAAGCRFHRAEPLAH